MIQTAMLILIGVVTIYSGQQWEGQPLYCDRGNGWLYNEQTARENPWVAIDVRLYEQGIVQCGDRVTVELENGTTIAALALDAGPFEGHTFLGGPVIVDVPAIVLDQMGIAYWGVKWGEMRIRPDALPGLIVMGRGKRMVQ